MLLSYDFYDRHIAGCNSLSGFSQTQWFHVCFQPWAKNSHGTAGKLSSSRGSSVCSKGGFRVHKRGVCDVLSLLEGYYFVFSPFLFPFPFDVSVL